MPSSFGAELLASPKRAATSGDHSRVEVEEVGVGVGVVGLAIVGCVLLKDAA
jgi:hypothetical protein